MGLTLCAAIHQQEAIGGTFAHSVLGGGAGSFLNKARRTWSPTTMALLDPVLASCEGAYRAGVALPHGCRGTVERHIGACGALVADQLGARVRVGVLIVAGREEGLVSWAGCGQNPS